jgi:Helix-turn-helix domain
MSLTTAPASRAGQALPRHLRPRREKVFGDGRPLPLDRNAKVRVMTLARALMRRTEPGKHYGQITAKALAVLEALLWGFHNARSGLCFPSYKSIAAKADCAPSTVGEAIKALEDAGLLSWVNRITRIRERCEDLFGRFGTRWRVIRTSNGYRFHDPKAAASRGFASKTDFQSGTPIQDSSLLTAIPQTEKYDPANPLDRALINFGKQLGVHLEVKE